MALTAEQLQKLLRSKVGPSGNRVQKAMDLAELTQAQLADHIHLAQPYISDVARGRYPTITVDNARKFAEFFDCSIEDLFPSREKAQVA